MGDARFDYSEVTYGFFDRFLKGEQRTRLDTLPKVTYYTMGSNKWQTAETWPPPGRRSRATFYLSSAGQRQHASRRRRADAAAPDAPTSLMRSPTTR